VPRRSAPEPIVKALSPSVYQQQPQMDSHSHEHYPWSEIVRNAFKETVVASYSYTPVQTQALTNQTRRYRAALTQI